MTRLTDKTKIASITIRTWRDGDASPDFSQDFYAVGSLPYDDDLQAYVVEDVDYCIEQAEDWQLFRGDFHDDEELPDTERQIFIDCQDA